VAVYTGPDGFAGSEDVVDLPAARVDAGMDATQKRDEGRSSRIEVNGITSLNSASPGPNITAYRWGSRSAKRR